MMELDILQEGNTFGGFTYAGGPNFITLNDQVIQSVPTGVTLPDGSYLRAKITAIPNPKDYVRLQDANGRNYIRTAGLEITSILEINQRFPDGHIANVLQKSFAASMSVAQDGDHLVSQGTLTPHDEDDLDYFRFPYSFTIEPVNFWTTGYTSIDPSQSNPGVLAIAMVFVCRLQQVIGSLGSDVFVGNTQLSPWVKFELFSIP